MKLAAKVYQRALVGEGQMTFEEIAERLGVTRQRVIQIYDRALRKIAQDREMIDRLKDWEEYHRQLRARSAECLAAQEHW